MKRGGSKVLWSQGKEIFMMGMSESPEIAANDKAVKDPLVQYLEVANRLPGFVLNDAVG